MAEFVLFGLLNLLQAAIVLFGFSAAFYVCFGAYAEGFMSLGTSAGSLVLVCLGSFDYRVRLGMGQANPWQSPCIDL